MEKILIQYKSEEEVFVDLNCFDIIPNMYKINCFGLIMEQVNRRPIYPSVRNGYLINSLRNTGGTLTPYSNHRLVAAMFCANVRDDRDIVNHIDGDKSNNYYRNLEWCTNSENILHAHRTGLCLSKGEDNPNAKFTNLQINNICKLMEQGMQYSEILNTLDIDNTQKSLDILTKIRTGKLWANISKNYNLPEKEYRDEQAIYNEAMIHKICQLLQDGATSGDVANFLEIDMSIRKNADKFYKFIGRIKDKSTYQHITGLYDIPEKQNRSIGTKLTEEQVCIICEYLVKGINNVDIISKHLGIVFATSRERRNFYNTVARIRLRKQYIEISKDYVW